MENPQRSERHLPLHCLFLRLGVVVRQAQLALVCQLPTEDHPMEDPKEAVIRQWLG
jgi:hypothetical protein